MSASTLRAAGIVLGVTAVLAVISSVRAADSAHGDFSGPWQIRSAARALTTIEGKAPPLLPAAQETYRTNQAGKKTNPHVDPLDACLPPGVPRLMTVAMPFNIVQGHRTIALMFQWNHLTRLIYMDRAHFDTIGPIYLGQSVGQWEGNVLVVDSNSFNDETWLDDSGLPHSTELHTVERWRLISGGRELEDRITIEDPKVYSQAWTARLVFTKKPGAMITEDYCLGRTGQGKMAP